jgi:hypothetical protein
MLFLRGKVCAPGFCGRFLIFTVKIGLVKSAIRNKQNSLSSRVSLLAGLWPRIFFQVSGLFPLQDARGKEETP